MSTRSTSYRRPFRKGAVRAASLVETQIREAGERRGFAVSRLLTRWGEIAGAEIASVARPVNVSYGRGRMGATLTLLTNSANAPLLEMQKERLRERVNACYGYAAISRIRITQTAPTGFDTPGPAPAAPETEDPRTVRRARDTAAPVRDPELRAALERLGTHVLGPAPRTEP